MRVWDVPNSSRAETRRLMVKERAERERRKVCSRTLNLARSKASTQPETNTAWSMLVAPSALPIVTTMGAQRRLENQAVGFVPCDVPARCPCGSVGGLAHVALECPKVSQERGELLKVVEGLANTLTQNRWATLPEREKVLFTATLKRWPQGDEKVVSDLYNVASHGWKRSDNSLS